MLTLSQLMGVRVYKTKPAGRRARENGQEEKTVRLGKVHNAVFSPDGRRVVGLMVRRPDVAGMVKREDAFLALDSLGVIDEGIVCTRGDDSFDERARRRLGLPWDECIIWAGMDVRTESGKRLGYVDDVSFSPKTGEVKSVSASDGGMANALVGSFVFEGEQVVGYEDGFMVVTDEAGKAVLSGGFAARAGEASGRAKIKATEVGQKAGKAVGEAVDVGSHQLGRAIGKAQRAVRRATQADPDVESVPAREPRVSGGSPKELKSGAGSRPAGKGAKPSAASAKAAGKAKSSAKAGKSSSAAGAKRTGKGNNGKAAAKTASAAANKAARVAGKQLKKTKGMFGSFVEEFQKNSK